MLEALSTDITPTSDIMGMVCLVQSCVLNRSKMWGQFLEMRTSTDAWKKIMDITIQQQASPIFFQKCTDFIFVKRQYPLPATSESLQPLPHLTFEEENALRYAAGYVVKHLREKIERNSNPLKESLCGCLEDMCKSDDEDDSSTSWTMQISRGRLKLVNSNSYRFFVAVETKL